VLEQASFARAPHFTLSEVEGQSCRKPRKINTALQIAEKVETLSS